MVKVAHSINANAREAADELAAQLGGVKPRLILCFSSTLQEPHELLRDLHRHYHDAVIAGGTTAGEIVSGKMFKGGVVAMALEEDVVERCASVVIEDLGPAMDLDAAFASLERHLGEPLDEADPDTTVGIVVIDGMSGAEEKLIEAIGKRTDIPFIGGSAGDDRKFQKTKVFLGKNVHEGAALLLLLKVPRGYEIVKTQSFENTGIVLEATEVDEPSRKIISLNRRPAVYAYAEAVGAIPDAIADSFTTNPLARLVGGEPFIRSPQRIEGTAIKFYCGVKKGEKLAVMRATDIVTDTKAAVARGLADAGGARGIVDFHCILRALELESKGLAQDYGAIFKDVPTVGFCTYGEAWTTHINQTSTMLLFK